ncbi:POT family-domain-containing protein [Chlamydoabsidia padenii]|nr:POT family-domain-containing protein [Chlamydoabsidia padenii]
MDQEKKEQDFTVSVSEELVNDVNSDGYPAPTEQDWAELRETSDTIPKAALLVILIEFCERFTYYGLSGPFQNYIQFPDPPSYPASQPGALGKGQQTATALTTFFQFWCYITPIIGAIVADSYLGKYKSILYFSIIYFVGLLILTLSSIPAAIQSGAAFPGFVVAIIVIGLGTGGIKSNVSPLVAEQYRSQNPYVKTLAKTGERVIVTPQATYQKLFNMFYWGINVGSLSAIATTSLEKYVGFWSAYLLPTLMFIPGIITVVAGKNQYVQNPPRGSIFIEVFKVLKVSFGQGLEAAKPSHLLIHHPDLAAKATWDDVFVDELRRTFRACAVFCWFPIYWLCYSQMTNNLISMTATMQTGDVPNDILQNINPLTLIIAIPVFDSLIYPAFRRLHMPLRPIMRMTFGFVFASVAMAYCAIIQSHIYRQPPYYDHPDGRKNDVTVALAIPAYVLIGISEIFASITGLEYAFKKAPAKMKSLVMALFLFTNCLASVLGFALVSVAVDPKLTWLYTGVAAAMGICAPLFYWIHGKNDRNDIADDAIGRSDDYQQDYSPPSTEKMDPNTP